MISVIKTPYSNFFSVACALERLGCDYQLVENPDDVSDSTTHLILPGVGHAEAMMNHLIKTNWKTFITNTKLPFLGICLGFQILFDYLEEGNVAGLGIFQGNVTRLPFETLPHIGWSKEIGQADYFYYVHSYGVLDSSNTAYVLQGTLPVVSRAKKSNYFGTQFHPERSGKAGEAVLKEFLCM